MLVHELRPDECLEVLSRTDVGRLACSRDDQPYIVPIHFSLDRGRGCVYGFSGVGQKVQWMRENPKVCLEVERISDRGHWQTVLVFGRYEEVGDEPDEAETRRRALERFQERRDWWLPGAARVDSRGPRPVVVFRILIDRVTGRRAASGAADGG